ncbi:MAG: DNA mismatch repair endonuclease MutL [Pseudomonadota bacterium]
MSFVVPKSSSRTPIRVLPEWVVQKIAAGEVIERPASIVKELVENSLDAGAHRIEIHVEDGGRKSIRVTDDGCGIPAHEAALALASHATSKIASDKDLAKISSFGFRGEALSSIAVVSHVDLTTRTAESPSGIRIRVEGGKLKLNEPFGAPPGTTVSVAHLFFNTPARRKFLRSPATELGHIETMIRRMALSRLDCEFLLMSDQETLLHLSKTDSPRGRVTQLYGSETMGNLIEFEGKLGPHRAHGFVSNHRITFSKPQQLWLFVNGRTVADRVLRSAVLEGFRTALMEGRYPLAILFLTLPPELVDVNVHPTKAEVRFSDSQPIFRVISEAVARGIRSHAAAGWGDSVPEPAPTDGSHREPSPLALDLGTLTASSLRAAPVPYGAPEPEGKFSALEFLGTLDQTYLFLKGHSALFVIDQHAAHERVKFEELKHSLESGSPKVQHLLVPLTFEVTSQQEAILNGLEPFLRSLGFSIEPFGPKTFVIKSVPDSLGAHDPRPLLIEMFGSFSEEEARSALQDRRDEILSRVACHSAVRAHDRLSAVEIRDLLARMDGVDLSGQCPHGRPAYLRFSLSDLERLFHRK